MRCGDKKVVFLIGKTVVGIDRTADMAVIPDDATGVYIKNADDIEEVVFSKPDQLNKLKGTSFNTLVINNRLNLSVNDLLDYLSDMKAWRLLAIPRLTILLRIH